MYSRSVGVYHCVCHTKNLETVANAVIVVARLLTSTYHAIRCGPRVDILQPEVILLYELQVLKHLVQQSTSLRTLL